MNKIVKYAGLVVVLILIVGQIFPPDRTNPPMNPASTFDAIGKASPEVKAIVRRSCYDCHSNETVWPWYSRIAPVSWMVVDDVRGGRAHLNFSEWGFLSPEMADKRLTAACDEARTGDMPLWNYLLIHRDAKLSEADIDALCAASGQTRQAGIK